jgi:5'-nucleotidase
MRIIYSLPVFSFLLCTALIAACAGQPNVGEVNLKTLKIYHTNDIHAHLSPDARGRGGLSYLTSVLKVIRAQDNNALILDAGDFYKKGSLPSQNTKDEVTAELMEQLHYYDARAVGNNEIKVGIPKLLQWAKTKESAPLLSANFVDKDKKPVFQPYIILKKSGLTVGIIGVTPKVPIEDDVQADPKKDFRAPYQLLDPNEAVLPYIVELRPKVDVLILVAHNHYRDNLKFAADHPEVDLIVSGHSHFLTGDQKVSNKNMVVEAGQFGQQIGAVTLVFNENTKKVVEEESTFWPVGHGLQLPDEAMAAAIKEAYSKYAPDAFLEYGQASDTFTVVDFTNPIEGTFDDWVADKFCENTHCDVALINREMLREPLYKGIINKERIFLSAPYDDHIATVHLSPTKLAQMLKTNVENSMTDQGLFSMNFTGMTAHLWLKDHKYKNVEFSFNSPKKDLVVSMPAYMITHCREFFKESECPFVNVENGSDVRELLETAVKNAKVIQPPMANRIVVDDKVAEEETVDATSTAESE